MQRAEELPACPLIASAREPQLIDVNLGEGQVRQECDHREEVGSVLGARCRVGERRQNALERVWRDEA